ncbi:hypothetical protein JTE90_004654 [Oedothorax gibbosus]|uniref:Uncharacterized protein n=1 Tax=Oedothorax gibbosus TaxID=931172 RepID=A0AAV6UYV1_9ARAC|nr:hypothetical protein JTE90_004654 [Oedothorax gibbosus]
MRSDKAKAINIDINTKNVRSEMGRIGKRHDSIQKHTFCCAPGHEGFENVPIFPKGKRRDLRNNTLDSIKLCKISFEALDRFIETLVHKPFLNRLVDESFDEAI